ncbi:hypothetical protein [Streptomyces sp. SAJ15]|nr:hypothetical protein [Streptomyces sp. SAJ15]
MPLSPEEVRATVAAVLGERAALHRFEEVEEAVLFCQALLRDNELLVEVG